MSEKFQENVTVLKQQCIGKDIYDMTIQTKHIAGHAKAGQFVSLYSNDASKLLPRPISLCGIDAEAGTLRLVYRVTGEGTGTEEFSRLKEGDKIRVLGPLGNGFTVEPGKKAFLIGGGIGIPPMLELAKTIWMNLKNRETVTWQRKMEVSVQREMCWMPSKNIS